MSNLQTQTPSTLYRKIGCYGCLIYLVLFVSLAGIVTQFGLDTLWAVVILALFVVIWLLAMAWSIRKPKT